MSYKLGGIEIVSFVNGIKFTTAFALGHGRVDHSEIVAQIVWGGTCRQQ